MEGSDTLEHSCCEECDITLDVAVRLLNGVIEKPIEVIIYPGDSENDTAIGTTASCIIIIH